MKKNVLLLIAVVILAIVPFFIQQGAEFGGADGKGEKAINEISPNYEPWLNSLWEPPSVEIESLLFALQAAIGAGFIGYFIGYMKGKSKKTKEQGEKVSHVINR